MTYVLAVELLLEVHDKEMLNLVEGSKLGERNEDDDGSLLSASGDLLGSMNPEILDFVGELIGGGLEIKQGLGNLLV